MAYVIPERCVGTRDTACVDASPVDCIHLKKNTSYEDGRPSLNEITQLHIDPWRASIAAPGCRSSLSRRFLQ